VSVLEDVRRRLAADRAAGVPFDEAWPRAVAEAPGTWTPALEATRDTWAAAYAGTATTSGERAAQALSSVMAVVALRDNHAETAERRHGRARRFELVA
jgi:hypothetical protein